MNDNCPKCNRTMKRIASGYRCRRCSYFKPVKAETEAKVDEAELQRAKDAVSDAQETLDKVRENSSSTPPQRFSYSSSLFGLSGLLGSNPWVEVRHPADNKPRKPLTRPELLRELEAALERHSERLEEMQDARDDALRWCYGSIGQEKRVNKKFEPQIKALLSELEELETKWANLRDSLDEPIDDAATRDAVSMRLLDY